MLIFILLIVLLIFFYDSSRKKQNTPLEDPLLTRNREWVQYILSFRKYAKTKDQKALLDKMVADMEAKGYPVLEGQDLNDETPGDYKDVVVGSDVTRKTPAQVYPVSTPESQLFAREERKAQTKLDNASLLLYLGAFLFVASAGLFVVFAGIPGELRSFIVAATVLIMYGGGLYLFHNNQKLKQAGLAFAGIGIALAPLFGLAVYKYIFDQSNGAEVWFGTSILCLVMYLHALFSLRRTLINYIFILTFLSLFESAVSIIDVPIYYFGWALAAVGLICLAISKFKNVWPEFQESTRLSSSVFMPISVFVSLAMVSSHGVAQLGVSLLLAAAYYGLQISSSIGESQEMNALASQTSLLLGLGSLAYAYDSSWAFVSVVMCVLAIAQTMFVYLQDSQSVLMKNVATITIVSAIVAPIAGYQKPAFVLASTAVTAVLCLALWHHQKREDSYVVAIIALMALPIIFGKYVSHPVLDDSSLALLLTAPVVLQHIFMTIRHSFFSEQERETTQAMYLLSSTVVVVGCYFAPGMLALALCSLLAFSMILLNHRHEDSDWIVAAGLFITAPLLWTWGQPRIFLWSILASLLLNIALALVYRKEHNRWISAILWLLLPLALGNISAFGHWDSGAYAWAYLVAMAGLMLSRAVARGVVLASSTIPVASYARNASLSYSVGYWFSAFLSIVLSVQAGDNAQTAILLSIVTLAVWLLAEVIDKTPTILVLIPFFAQGIALSLIHPDDGTSAMVLFTLVSTAIALFGYLVIESLTEQQEKRTAIQQGSLITVFITPVLALFISPTIWTMPVGLIAASLLVLYHIRESNQNNRELAGGLVLCATLWLAHFLGIRNVQFYTHAFVLLFGAYAYWRNSRSETQESDDYLKLMFFTATIPLALQALGGTSGGLYGWWLILEQIVFMLLGMEIKKRFITMWGLYVAVGAVLYQLRGLGWAALAFLAVFLIGLAIYRIQKND